MNKGHGRQFGSLEGLHQTVDHDQTAEDCESIPGQDQDFIQICSTEMTLVFGMAGVFEQGSK